MNTDSVKVSWVFAAMFMWVSFLGFIPNFFPGEKIFLGIYVVLKFIHLITAICFIVVARLDENTRVQSMLRFGLVYLLISGIGFMGMNIEIGEQWEAVIRLNLLNYVQFSLGVALSAVGMILNKRPQLVGSTLVST
jgi:hypothetical protein